MAQTKPLFVPWLYQQIESEKYPGVCWKNEEKTKFCIPWKHALRQDSNSDDVRIFKASQELYSADEDVFTNLAPHDLDQHFIDLDLREKPTQVGAFGGSEQTLHLEGTSVGDFSAAERMSDKATCYPDEEHVRNQAATSGTNETYFQIKVYYKGKMMLDQLLKNDAGFRLIYQESRDSSVMESALPVVKLPSPDSIQDQTQARHTRDILENLGGLELKKLDSVVWGHRWGKTRVYWGVCKHEKSQTARELSKNTPQVIYFFKDYISGMMEFLQKSSGPSPSYTLYFCLGEKWPDPKMKPWEKKLIMIEVVLTSLEILKTMALECGASSLQSMELQVSLEQMMELC
ncbi:interferon regulatory factor 3 isoform X9 [Misgurnus anguillicaudatus]|uniref:interferon regulatory factor 3 isoform X9 n=1 Tax=Misgurnus anguillicaudatus TaxID=75329 RepID=UPI002434FD49|nr:interferon regulatory factor 3 isoform X8 [Misgurnus anguillicaudatus]